MKKFLLTAAILLLPAVLLAGDATVKFNQTSDNTNFEVTVPNCQDCPAASAPVVPVAPAPAEQALQFFTAPAPVQLAYTAPQPVQQVQAYAVPQAVQVQAYTAPQVSYAAPLAYSTHAHITQVGCPQAVVQRQFVHQRQFVQQPVIVQQPVVVRQRAALIAPRPLRQRSVTIQRQVIR